MNRCRYSAFREMCTQSKPWGEAFNKAKHGVHTAMPLLKKDNGQVCKTADENTALLLAAKLPPSPSTMLNTARYTGIPGLPDIITDEEVTGIIKKLPTNKAPGPDTICNRTLKALNCHHPTVLPHLFTACLLLGYFPANWRSGRVVFVPKPGKDLTVPEGYWPITLLSTLGKAYEKIIMVPTPRTPVWLQAGNRR